VPSSEQPALLVGQVAQEGDEFEAEQGASLCRDLAKLALHACQQSQLTYKDT
jgi:hypothetical protein